MGQKTEKNKKEKGTFFFFPYFGSNQFEFDKYYDHGIRSESLIFIIASFSTNKDLSFPSFAAFRLEYYNKHIVSFISLLRMNLNERFIKKTILSFLFSYFE